jgi:hypothetical protein
MKKKMYHDCEYRTYQSDALAHPRAMVIKTFNTVVAYGAMRTTRRAIQHTSFTIFHLYRKAIDHYFFCSWELKGWRLLSAYPGRLIMKLFFWWM